MAFKKPQGFQLHDPVAQRALMEIGQFTKDIRHIAGHANIGSDYLSRIPPESRGSEYDERQMSSVEPASNMPIEGHKLIAMSPLALEESQKSCQDTTNIKNGKHPSDVIFGPVKFGETELYCELIALCKK